MLMLKRNTDAVVKIFLTDSTDHISPYDSGVDVGRKAYLDLLSGSGSLTVNANFVVQHRLPGTAGNGYTLSLVAGASLVLTSESGSATVITFNSGVTTALELADFIDASCAYLEVGFMNVNGSSVLGGSDAFAATALANGRNNINGDSLLMYTVDICKEGMGWRKETFGTSSDRILVMCPIGSLTAGTPRVLNRDSGELHLHVAAALLDTLGEVAFRVSNSGGAGAPDLPAMVRAQVVAFDPDDIVRMGMTALPSVAFGAVGGFASMITATGTAQAGTTSTITLEAGASATTSHHNGDLIHVVAGTGVGQSRLIKSYLGGTKVATVTPNWTVAPDATSVYICRPWSGALEDSAVRADAIGTSALSSTKFAASAITASALATDAITAAKIAADAITEIQAGLATTTAVADVQTDVDDIQARLPAALVGGRMDASVGAMAADTVTASALAPDAVTEIQAGLATSTQVDALEGDTTTLLSRLSAVRAGYLDNLDVGGLVASSAEATSIQNNTRVVRVVPDIIERPDSGTVTYRIELFLYDSVGNMEAPDSAPTIALANQTGTDLSARLDSTTMSLVSTGWYRAIYTADAAHALDQLLWAFSVVEGGATRVYGNNSLIVDTTAVDFTSTDRAKLDQLAADYTSVRAANLDNLDATVSSRLAPTVTGRTLDVSTGGEAGIDWANVGSPTTVLNLSGTTIKRATDNPTVAEIDTQLSATHGAGTWGSGSLTTSQIAAAVWNALLTDYTLSGSMGEALALVTGLSQGNYVIDQANHGVNGQTSARIRLFRNSTAVNAATDGGTGEGEFATFVALTEYVGPNKIKIHRVGRS